MIQRASLRGTVKRRILAPALAALMACTAVVVLARPGAAPGDSPLGISASLQAAGESSSGKPSLTGVRTPSFAEQYESAKYLISTGRLKEASSLLKRLKKVARASLERAMMNEALASYHLAKTEPEAAQRYASLAIRECPTFSFAFSTRALARRKAGDFLGAEEDFRYALSLRPRDTKSLRALAELYLARSRTREALGVLERFLDVDSLDAWAQDAWAGAMATVLGRDRFPPEYLRCLKTAAVTRGELAAILIVGLELGRLTSDREGSIPHAHFGTALAPSPGPTGGSVPPSDCPGTWFEPFVRRALDLGIMTVYPDGTFRPNDPVRKGVLAVDLYCFVTQYYGDVPDSLRNGELDEMLHQSRTPTYYNRGPHPAYRDVNSSSYLWRPALALVSLGVLLPDSESEFGVESHVGGTEAERISARLAALVY